MNKTVVDLKTAAVMAGDYALTNKKQEESGYRNRLYPDKPHRSNRGGRWVGG